jgi:hypothetical protein
MPTPAAPTMRGAFAPAILALVLLILASTSGPAAAGAADDLAKQQVAPAASGLRIAALSQAATASAPEAAKPAAAPAGMINTGFALTLAGAAAQFGSAVAVAGDVNGDGYSDLIVGAPNFSNGQSGEGEVLLFLGGPGGYASTPSWTYESNVAGANLGWIVAPAGDVNGDGYADVIVGAPNLSSNSLTNNGRAYVFLGGPSGLASTPAWTFDGTQAGQLLGWSVCTAGDVNGDGYDDVIVGSPGYYNIAQPPPPPPGGRTVRPAGVQQTQTVFNNGRAQVFLGSASGLAGTPQWDKAGFQYGGAFGYSVSTAHDVNGDGYDDVVVGMPYGENLYTSVTGAGEFEVYQGGPSGLPITASAIGYGQGTNELRGFSVAGIGDMDGDGYADVAVGAPGYTDAVASQGAVFVYAGTSLGLFVEAWVFFDEGPVFNASYPGGQFGYSVAPAGDVNGDGFADLVVGGPFYSTNVPNAIDVGYVAVYQGTSRGSGMAKAFSTTGQRGSESGYSVCAAGEEDGGGFGDVVSGAPTATLNDGRVAVFMGAADPPQQVPGTAVAMPPPGTFNPFVYSAGDIDGDGFDDLAVNLAGTAAPIEFYRGGPGGLSTTPAWTIGVSSLAPGCSTCSLIRALSLGDLNGDGYDDIAISMQIPSYFPLHTYVLAGGPTGPHLPPMWDVSGEVTPVGDVNGDGFADCVRSSDNGSVSNPDTFEVHAGGPSGPNSVSLSTLVFPQGGSWVRPTFGPIGDFNGDGYSDMIVNDLKYNGTYPEEGRAMVFLGSPTGISTTPAVTYLGSAMYQHLFALFAGDLNGDGYADIVVADTSDFIVYGNNALPPLQFKQGGTQLLGGGDFNDDGFDDLACGSGIAFTIYPGSASGLSSTPWATVPILSLPWEYASQTCLYPQVPCDINGDGIPDLVTTLLTYSSPSTPDTAWVTVSYGNGAVTNAPGLDRVPQQRRSSDTAPIGLLGLSDQSSQFRLAANGRSAAGRARVRMESDVKNWGASYETNLGTLVHDGWTATGAPGTFGSFVALDASRALPTSGATDKWRMRIATHSPYFPGAPWLSPIGNGRAEYDLRNASSAAVAAVGPASVPSRLEMAAPEPNPSHGKTELTFSLPRRASVDLAIYDLAGRRIATVMNGEAQAGTHVAVWDGGGSRERRAVEGVYFAELVVDGQRLTKKIVLVR